MAANVVSGSGDSNKMLGRELPMFIIDAFSGEPFSGNPAAVCLVGDEDLSDEIKQKIAAEMNLSETAFIRALSPADDFDKACRFGLRWWTPTNEVNLCGHATMASAAALFNIVGNGSPQLEFETRSGTLIAKKQDECITIDLPLNPCTEEDPSSISDLIKATLGDIEPQDVQYAPGANKDLLLRVPDSMTRESFEKIQPDTAALMKAYGKQTYIGGVIITLKGHQKMEQWITVARRTISSRDILTRGTESQKTQSQVLLILYCLHIGLKNWEKNKCMHASVLHVEVTSTSTFAMMGEWTYQAKQQQ
ncbi:phenazine biosynthesis-like domain-containing protein isoform X4 [Amphiura filiformis]|uniref:phenazine biosynthesis-like domain-containing protein isoform X4 n=1 Tax=Amphiura filiformis TaxID=82378 RepID=UPI003B20E850